MKLTKKQLQHFYDTSIGLTATDKPIEYFNKIVSEAMDSLLEELGYHTPAPELTLTRLLIAEKKIKEVTFELKPIETSMEMFDESDRCPYCHTQPDEDSSCEYCEDRKV
jgi:hypothetical protein